MKPGLMAAESFIAMEMIHLHPDTDLLERYSMHRATTGQTEFVEEHLLVCELCRANLEIFEIDRYLMELVLGCEDVAVAAVR